MNNFKMLAAGAVIGMGLMACEQHIEAPKQENAAPAAAPAPAPAPAAPQEESKPDVKIEIQGTDGSIKYENN